MNNFFLSNKMRYKKLQIIGLLPFLVKAQNLLNSTISVHIFVINQNRKKKCMLKKIQKKIYLGYLNIEYN